MPSQAEKWGAERAVDRRRRERRPSYVVSSMAVGWSLRGKELAMPHSLLTR